MLHCPCCNSSICCIKIQVMNSRSSNSSSSFEYQTHWWTNRLLHHIFGPFHPSKKIGSTKACNRLENYSLHRWTHSQVHRFAKREAWDFRSVENNIWSLRFCFLEWVGKTRARCFCLRERGGREVGGVGSGDLHFFLFPVSPFIHLIQIWEGLALWDSNTMERSLIHDPRIFAP